MGYCHMVLVVVYLTPSYENIYVIPISSANLSETMELSQQTRKCRHHQQKLHRQGQTSLTVGNYYIFTELIEEVIR